LGKYRWVEVLRRTLCIIAQISLLIVFSFGFVSFTPTASADDLGLVTNSPYPVVYVYPNYTTVGVGESFTIAVVGFNFTDNVISDPGNPTLQRPLGNLYGFDIEFTWDPTILHYLSHTVTCPFETYPAPNTPSPYGGVLHSPPPPLEVVNVVDEAGNIPDATSPETRAWFAYAAMNPALAQNGNCTFFTMTFSVVAEGASSLRILKCDLAGGPPGYGEIYRIVKDGLYRTVGVPVADFSYEPPIPVASVPVDFNAIVSSNFTNIATYMWDFGGEKQNTTVPTVSHAFASVGNYMVTLKVLDADGVESEYATKYVNVIVRDIRVAELTLPEAEKIKIGNMINVNATIENSGGIRENFTAYAYFNTTIVNATNPQASDWAFIGSRSGNVTAAYAGVNGTRKMSFPFNTTALAPMTYYYLLVNVTGIPAQFERVLTDNCRLSDAAIFATNEIEHDVMISSFDCVLRIGTGPSAIIRPPPLIEGELATIRLTVRNNGASNDTASITLYSDNVVIEQFDVALRWGETKVVDPWQESLAAGNHNVTLLVQAGSFTANATRWVRIVKPPQIQVDVSPSEIIANQTLVTFSSNRTLHQDPDGMIVSWTWSVYAPGANWTINIPTAILNGATVTYNFTRTGNWTVILEITDNYGLTYEMRRSATAAYMSDTDVPVLPELPTAVALLMLALASIVLLKLARNSRMGARFEKT
jgi:PKD repeat protein